MGLLSRIPGVGSGETDDETDAAGDDPDQIYQMFLADEQPWDTAFEDYRIMVGEDPEQGGDQWGMMRCTEDTYIPEGTQLYIFEQGAIVSLGKYPYQLHLAQMVQPENIEDESEYDGVFVDLPEEITGGNWPARTPVDDEELQQFLISIGVNQQVASRE